MVDETIIAQIRSLPKLHLFNYLQVDGASMYANFIQAVYEDCCFSRPATVELFASGEYHLAQANGCYVELEKLGIPAIPPDYKGASGLLDMLYKDRFAVPSGQPNPLLPFDGLVLMVCCAEWCLIDISTKLEHFRQAFYQGHAVTPCERRAAEQRPPDAPCIHMQFTLGAPDVFRSRVVTADQFRQALLGLRKHRLVPKPLRLTSLKALENGFKAKLR